MAEAQQDLPVEELRRRISQMKLKLIDRETGESRYVTLAEAKTWDWDNPETWRLVTGWQITSWKRFISVLAMKAEYGIQEVEILEAPRFTMLAGG
jgi:hypothetical protein